MTSESALVDKGLGEGRLAWEGCEEEKHTADVDDCSGEAKMEVKPGRGGSGRQNQRKAFCFSLGEMHCF